MRFFLRLVLCTLAIALAVPVARANVPEWPRRAPPAVIDVQPLPSMHQPPPFDPGKATNAYLARVNGEARKRSDSYFEGGYALQVVDALYALAIAALLLWGRISAAMRNLAQSVTRSRFLQVPLYVAQYLALTTVLAFPLTVYEDFFREHAYGLSNQNFAQWFGDFATDFMLTLIAMLIVVTLIYAAIRAARRTWWAWGAAIAVIFLFVQLIIEPVAIEPLFNHYRPLPDSAIKQEILTLARANGIPATNIYEFDASRQSSRISANVSGFLGTTRISLTDNLLAKATPAEVKAVLAHEMGHYVLNHGAILLSWLGLLIVVGFAFLNWFFRALIELFGGSWDVRSIDDPAGLPLLMAGISVFMLISTPVKNTIIRTAEAQADIFGLNAAREPDGFATVTLKLSTYRKLDPSPLEEFVFYDHPSGRTRIAGAMRWKAGHLDDPDIKAGPASPQ